MEFMPVNYRGEICAYDAGSSPPHTPGVQGRYDSRLPMGLHVMFWCLVAVLCGTLQLSSAASTVPQNSTFALNLTVPKEQLYSKKAILVWHWHPHKPPASQIMSYFITYQQEGSNSKTVITVDKAFMSETLRNLEPDKPYRAFIKAMLNNTEVPLIESALTRFETPSQIVTPHYDGEARAWLKGMVTIVILLGLWVVVILLFWRQWRIIRQLEPTPSVRRYRAVEVDVDDGGTGEDSCETFKPYEPQNIDSVRVVTKVKDSVISGGSPKRSSLQQAWSDIDEEDEEEEVESEDEDVRLSTHS